MHFLGEATGPPPPPPPANKATACLFIAIVCRQLKVILPVLPVFGRTLQTTTTTEVFASVRNSR